MFLMRRLQHKIVYKIKSLFKSIQFVEISCFTGLHHIYNCKKNVHCCLRAVFHPGTVNILIFYIYCGIFILDVFYINTLFKM